jgi:hypothetical protein
MMGFSVPDTQSPLRVDAELAVPGDFPREIWVETVRLLHTQMAQLETPHATPHRSATARYGHDKHQRQASRLRCRMQAICAAKF